MFPFNNGSHNNFIPEPYPHTGFYGNQLYYVPQEGPYLLNPSNDKEDQFYPFQSPFCPDFPQLYEECAVKTEQKKTKPIEGIQKDDNQSSVSPNNFEDSQDHFPKFRFKQKYGRNINSNIFHTMLRRLLFEGDLKEMIHKVITREQTVLTEQQFMQFLARKQEKLRTYICFQKMKKMFQGQKYRNRIYQETLIKQREFCKVFRIVGRYYLKNIHPLYTYTVLKVRSESKRLHITGARRILEQLNPS